MKFVPHEYQARCIRFILEHPEAGLFLDMGLGKTVITLTAVRLLMYDRFEISKVLVIAPLKVAEDTWSREAEKWDHLRDLRISRILGSAKQRIAAIRSDADVYVVNRENTAWLVNRFLKAKQPWPYDMVVIDELSSFKSGQSQRFKAVRKIRPQVQRIVGLTGTPAANSLLDLWAEIGLLDQGERLGRFVGRYRDAYFRPAYISPQGAVYKYNPKPGALEAITSRISDITISLKAADYLDLPDQIEIDRFVALPERARDSYRKMEREALLLLGDDQITALSAAAVLTKLAQIANGFAYGEDHEARWIHDAKLEALNELVGQLGEAGDSALVFYEFREDADRILKFFDGDYTCRKLEGEKDIEDWNNGKIGLLLAHPASVGYGLNLQAGGHVIIWYGLTWSLEQYLQANARLHRQGQEKPVLIYRILAKDTVDDQILESLGRKDKTQNSVLEILKKRREKL